MHGRAFDNEVPPTTFTARILLLGSGELGREFVISAKRLGAHVVACDSYDGAPAMQMADECEVFSMLDAEALRAAIEKHKPDFIVPEIEAIRTEVLAEFEDRGLSMSCRPRAPRMMTMNRDRIRDVAANELGLPTSTLPLCRERWTRCAPPPRTSAFPAWSSR